MSRRLAWPTCFLLVISGVLVAIRGGLHAQASQICFRETGFCIEGRFREFWEQNGGLPVFGFTVTAQQEQSVEGGQFLTQWLERTRFELHPENAPPYDVLLGRLGDDRLRQLGRVWQSEPHASGPQPGCLWFEQTSHNICDQADGIGFKTYWETHGLQDPLLDAYQRSLALFGLPLTAPALERSLTDGKIYLTQWFERARFEWHPDEPDDQYKVLLGLLGNEVLGRGLPPTPPPPIPTPQYLPTPTPTPTRKPKPPKPTPKPTPPPPIPTPVYLQFALGAGTSPTVSATPSR